MSELSLSWPVISFWAAHNFSDLGIRHYLLQFLLYQCSQGTCFYDRNLCKSRFANLLTSSNEAQVNFETEPAWALISLASDRWCTSLRNANHTEEPLWVCCVTLWGSLEHSLGTSANDPSNSYDLNVTKEFQHNEQLLGEGEMITQE